jgi:hypothetical protein
MVTTDMILYLGMFLMPTMVHALIVLVLKFTLDTKEQKPAISLLFTISIPILWYLFSQITLPLYKVVEENFSIHILLIFIICGTLLFLFFLIRTLYILTLKKSQKWNKYELVWKIPITILFPVLGLIVNNGGFVGFPFENGSGIFGDFSNPWFLILAICNGLLLCLPKNKNKSYRLFLFIGKSILFSYTFYFFIVFLPFLPLSVLAIIALGAGLLMLSPLALFVIHIKELTDDYLFLSNLYSNKIIIRIQITAFLFLPITITFSNYYHKFILNETLDYVYNPDYSRDYTINKASLQNTLHLINTQKERRNNDFIFGDQTPILSSYFNWIVLDNLTLSDNKINTIEALFDGTALYLQNNETIGDSTVSIKDIQVQSHFDSKRNYWKSWVNFEIKNHSQENWAKKYTTHFSLPTGCWISDYYLYVGQKKEMGLLAEKKAAKWVFSQIENENRDPGILSYLEGNTVEFKVFPFASNEVRKTGIEFIHKEPIILTIDGKAIALGDAKIVAKEPVKNDLNKNTLYVSKLQKANLSSVQRTPYFHFIVDLSKGNEQSKKNYIQSIEKLLKSKNIDARNAKICYTNTYAETENILENWKENLNSKTCEGGFYLERAIKKIAFENYVQKDKKYPIIIVLSNAITNAILPTNFSDFKITFPENDFFYSFCKNKLYLHSLVNEPRNQTEVLDFKTDNPVLAYPNLEKPITYLPIDDQASIVLKTPVFELKTPKQSKEWESGLELQGQWISQVLYPEKATKYWIAGIKQSFVTKIMTPQTSYIVVENEAQKAMLVKKQNDVLSGNKALDLEDESQRMSEPNTVLIILLLAIFFIFIKNKKVML